MAEKRGRSAPTTQIRVSPSQIKVKRRCERKWAFKYIDRLPEPTTAKQQFGTDGHTHMENWIKEGRVPPNNETGNVAKQLIRGDFLPQPSPHLKEWVEKFVSIPMTHIHEKAKIIGYSDLIVPPDLADPVPIVIDYKFTSSLRWAMTKNDAKEDPQSLIYAKYGMLTFKTDRARARFLYGVATNPRTGDRRPGGSKKVEVEFDSNTDEFKEAWARIEGDVAWVVHAKHNFKSAVEDAEPNPEACDDFGGCPFAKQCNLRKGQRMATLVENSFLLSQCDDNVSVNPPQNGEQQKDGPMSLMDKLKQRKTQQAEAAPEAETKTEEPKKSTAPLLDRLKAKSKSEGVNPPKTEAKEPSGPTSEETSTKQPEKSTAATSDPAGRMRQLEGTDLKDLKKMAKSMGLKGYSTMPKAALVSRILGEETGNASSQAEAEESPETKAQTFQEDQPRSPDGDAVEDKPAKSNTKTPEHAPSVPKTNGGAGLMVLFDCAMRKGNGPQAVENLSDWMHEVTKKVARDNDVAHFGLIEYAQGAPALAAALEAAFEAEPPNGCVLVDSYSLQGRAVKDVLIRHASIVIQGVR